MTWEKQLKIQQNPFFCNFRDAVSLFHFRSFHRRPQPDFLGVSQPPGLELRRYAGIILTTHTCCWSLPTHERFAPSEPPFN
jgi:hypothetical protein